MPGFIKIFFASLFGTLIGGGLLLFLSVSIIIGLSVAAFNLAEQKQSAPAPEMGTVLKVDLRFELEQYLDQDPFNRIDFDTFEVQKGHGPGLFIT